MRSDLKMLLTAAAFAVLTFGCGGGSSDNPGVRERFGFLSLSLADGPWHEAAAMMLHITHVELGRVDGRVVRLEFSGGPLDVDMMQLQNGVSMQIMNRVQVPSGEYQWLRLGLDMSRSHIDIAQTGGRHGLHMAPDAGTGLEVREQIQVMDGVHYRFMLDYDIRLGLRHRQDGMMGDRFELHDAMRLIGMEEVGGLTGSIDPAFIDINHADCDPAPGGNWAYLFPGDTAEPDDIADVENDGIPGPIATDRVDMDVATGGHFYHFGHLAEGSYRVAFTCSGEWDEAGDDDYPADPDALFDFQLFSAPIDVVAGQLRQHDMAP